MEDARAVSPQCSSLREARARIAGYLYGGSWDLPTWFSDCPLTPADMREHLREVRELIEQARAEAAEVIRVMRTADKRAKWGV